MAFVSELRAFGAEAEFIRADVRDDDDVHRLIERTIDRFGHLDAAVNNAGTEGQPGPLTEQTAASYAATFDTNVLGVLLCMKHELRVMLAQGKGSIVNVSSAFGKVGAGGAAVYAASKHAVEGLTKSAAIEVAGRGVRVNAVAPGPVDTGMLERFAGGSEGKVFMATQLPIQRLGLPEEVAAAIVFASLGEAWFMTGHSLSIDGGYAAA